MRLPGRAITLLLATPFAAGQQHADLLSQFSAAITPRSWDEAYALAAPFVARLSTAEKISLTTGTGIALGPCSGNVANIPRLKYILCLPRIKIWSLTGYKKASATSASKMVPRVFGVLT